MWKRLQKWIGKFEVPIAVIIGSIALTVLLLNLEFYFIEANFYDLRFSQGYQTKPDPDIVLVAVDEKTIKELNEIAPLSLNLHLQFFQALEKLGPKAVGYLIDMNHVFQLNSSQFQDGPGEQFVNTVKRMIQNGTPVLFGTPFEVTGEVWLPKPLDALPQSISVVHKDGNVFSEDKVTRRALLTLYSKPVFHLEFSRQLNAILPQELPRGAYYVPEVDGEYFFFRYHGNTKVSFQTPQTQFNSFPSSYPCYSLIDVLQGRISSVAFRNKIVLVGTVTPDDSSDYTFTPYSKTPFTNPKLVVHANILDSVLHKDGINRVHPSVNWIVTFIVTSTVLWWIMTTTPLYGVFATITLAAAFIVISQAFFQIKGLWIRESQPLVGIFVSYYLAVPYRLIREYKKRWHYQQKTQLMVQVEELKTNFLSLVTHDLKTPVARIQGLSEVLLKKASERLNLQDKENLNNIVKSTDELNHFITSILELSKVESNHIQIRLESKDINRLIETTLERFTIPAKSRGVEIQAHLEPLFPVRIDASLISKVLNNLIDNAIKYSKPNSKVKVTSEEQDIWIVVSVQDEGIGMSSEERENLFTRFFRAKNDMTTSIPGTGLGLYLTKYFVEAHNGRVEVESTPGQGSNFRIFLPLETLPSEKSSFFNTEFLPQHLEEVKET